MLRKLAIITLCASTLATAKPPVMINGIFAGTAAYWITKSLCYGAAGATVAGAAATASVLVPGGAPIIAGIATNIALPGAGAAATAAGTMGAVIGSTASAAAATQVAGMAVVSTAATTGGVAGVVATIESASTTMGYIFTMIPWLP